MLICYTLCILPQSDNFVLICHILCILPQSDKFVLGGGVIFITAQSSPTNAAFGGIAYVNGSLWANGADAATDSVVAVGGAAGARTCAFVYRDNMLSTFLFYFSVSVCVLLV